MEKINKKHLLLLIGFLICVIIVQFLPSKKDPIIEELEQEKNLLKKQNNQLQYKILSFEKEIIKNDSIIDNASFNVVDSLFADYFKQ